MKEGFFAYRREGRIEPPYPKDWAIPIARSLRVVISLLGNYGSAVSGIHLANRVVVTYHADDFHPVQACVGEQDGVPIKHARKKDLYHTYELPTNPTNDIVQVGEMVEPDDIVFQIGFRDHARGVVTFGTMDRLTRHVSTVDSKNVDTNCESGSGVFTLEGKLIGMTLGILAPQTMAGVTVGKLLDI